MLHLDPDDFLFQPILPPDGLRPPEEPPPVPPAVDPPEESHSRAAAEDRPLRTHYLDDMDTILVSQAAFEELMTDLRVRPPEAASLLIGPKNHEAVTHFLPDEGGDASPASFTLDSRGLNRKLQPFLAADLDCKGIAHSHPPGVIRLSGGDLLYLRKVFLNPRNADLRRFLMPVVAGGRLFPYVVSRDERTDALCVRAAKLVLF